MTFNISKRINDLLYNVKFIAGDFLVILTMNPPPLSVTYFLTMNPPSLSLSVT